MMRFRLKRDPAWALVLVALLAWPGVARATFSIVARDEATGELGVAVASRVTGVGALVPYARADVGAVASQALCNPRYGPAGLEQLAAGRSPDEVIRALTGADAGSAERQVGVVDAHGRAAGFTGKACMAWAGHRTGRGYAIQGNLLEGAGVLDAMETAYRSSTGPLASRLLAALEAGERAGGDRRGKQSAALLVVAQGKGYAGLSDRQHDLRVDDSERPVQELLRLYRLEEALRNGLFHTGGPDLEGRDVIGQPAPELGLKNWLGGAAPETAGKVLVVRFWTVGCELCTSSMPALEDIWKRHRDKGLVVVGVHHPKSPAGRDDQQVIKTARAWGITFPIAQDPEWQTLKRWWLRGDRSFTSATLIVDRQSVIRFVHRGGEFHRSTDAEHQDCDRSRDLVEWWVVRLLAEAPGARPAGVDAPARPRPAR